MYFLRLLIFLRFLSFLHIYFLLLSLSNLLWLLWWIIFSILSTLQFSPLLLTHLIHSPCIIIFVYIFPLFIFILSTFVFIDALTFVLFRCFGLLILHKHSLPHGCHIWCCPFLAPFPCLLWFYPLYLFF